MDRSFWALRAVAGDGDGPKGGVAFRPRLLSFWLLQNEKYTQHKTSTEMKMNVLVLLWQLLGHWRSGANARPSLGNPG